MPRGALVALSLTTPATRPWSLTIGGTDVTIGPTGGTAWGVPIDSIQLDEQGPGGVSSLAFTVNDPTGAVWPIDGQFVEYRDVTNALTLFRGVVDHWDSSPAFGGQGRKLDVRATGIDSLLDWRFIPPMTVPNGTFLANAIAYLANLEAPELIAPGPWDSGGSLISGASLRNGNAAWPIGALQTADGVANALISGTWTWAGGTLRAAIDSLVGQAIYSGASGWAANYTPAVLVAVDPQYGLRVWCADSGDQPDDYTTLTIVDTAAGSIRAENLKYGGDPGDVLRAVSVTGASAAASGWFGDGSGVTGREDGFTDSGITTYDQAVQRAEVYLAAQAGRVRGTFELNDWTPSAATIHAGSILSITDTASNATGAHRIYAITRTFNDSGRQNWTVAFGGRAPSLANLTRRLTRATR